MKNPFVPMALGGWMGVLLGMALATPTRKTWLCWGIWLALCTAAPVAWEIWSRRREARKGSREG